MAFRRTASLSLATLLLALFGCAPTEPPAPTAEIQEATVEETRGPDGAGTLADRHWSLEAFGAGDTRVPPLEGTEITLSFTGDGQANGTGILTFVEHPAPARQAE